MKRSINSLIGYSIGATDGEIGKVKEFYFDDLTWTVRYLVVETGNWFNERKVLLSPQALLTPDWENKVIPINLTKEKIKNSPDIDTEKPVSRQQEIEMYEYYPWASYWRGGMWGSGMGLSEMVTETPLPPTGEELREKIADNKEADGDSHLRSTFIVSGYKILASDGKIGDVEDFIVDDTSWKIDYLVVDTGHWFPGKKVLILPKLVRNIEWNNSEVLLNLSERDVKNSPEYKPDEAISESYRANLQNYYGKFVNELN
ncbi:MAG: PRC-barrel domain-containing protein [Ginsengibacter sp.]